MRDEHHYPWAGILDPTTGLTRDITAPAGAPTSPYLAPVVLDLGDGRVVVAEGFDPNDQESPEGFFSIFEDPAR
jgi:hypothetical protein